MDRRFFKILKERQFSNDMSVYYAVSQGLYVVVVEDKNDIPFATYSSYDDFYARTKYNKWLQTLLKYKENIKNEEDLMRYESTLFS